MKFIAIRKPISLNYIRNILQQLLATQY